MPVFIGALVILFLVKEIDHHVLNLDKLTYSVNLESLASVSGSLCYKLVPVVISDQGFVSKLFADFQPDLVM